MLSYIRDFHNNYIHDQCNEFGASIKNLHVFNPSNKQDIYMLLLQQTNKISICYYYVLCQG